MKQKQMANRAELDTVDNMDSMVTHFQLHHVYFIEPQDQLEIYQCHLNVHTPLKIVFLNNFQN